MHYQVIIFDWEGTIIDPDVRLPTVYRTKKVEAYAGVVEVLRCLKDHGLKLAVATGKSRWGLSKELVELGFSNLFDCTRTAEETAAKPYPLMLQEILHELDISPSHALMVGDSPVDLQMAEAAGVDAVGVCYGMHTQDQLAPYPAKAYLKTINSLINFLGEPSRC